MEKDGDELDENSQKHDEQGINETSYPLKNSDELEPYKVLRSHDLEGSTKNTDLEFYNITIDKTDVIKFDDEDEDIDKYFSECQTTD